MTGILTQPLMTAGVRKGLISPQLAGGQTGRRGWKRCQKTGRETGSFFVAAKKGTDSPQQIQVPYDVSMSHQGPFSLVQ